jgi:hypothetical protein
MNNIPNAVLFPTTSNFEQPECVSLIFSDQFSYRQSIPTIAAAAVLVTLEMYQFPCFVLVPWMTPFAQGRLFLGMNAGDVLLVEGMLLIPE